MESTDNQTYKAIQPSKVGPNLAKILLEGRPEGTKQVVSDFNLETIKKKIPIKKHLKQSKPFGNHL